MKRTVLALFLYCSRSFGAEPPADAPVREHVCGEKEADLDAKGCSTKIAKGEPAPYSGVLSDDQEYVRQTRDRADKTGTLDHAESKDVLIPKGTLAILITGIIVVVAAGAATVTYVATKK